MGLEGAEEAPPAATSFFPGGNEVPEHWIDPTMMRCSVRTSSVSQKITVFRIVPLIWVGETSGTWPQEGPKMGTEDCSITRSFGSSGFGGGGGSSRGRFGEGGTGGF